MPVPPAPSWGLQPPSQAAALQPLSHRPQALPETGALLPRGLGRSYGDVCLNDGGTLIATQGMDRLCQFDPESGILEAEAGISFDAILRFALPRGFFLPVSPGTRYVTLGGAIANDVHGKNHHRAGCLGRHILSLDLLRSDGRIYRCSRTEQAQLFRATLAGLGLTGLILRARIRLRKIQSPRIIEDRVPMRNLAHFLELSDAADESHEYHVAWVDGLAKGEEIGRGLFMRGNHEEEQQPLRYDPPRSLSIPMYAPGFLLNPLTVKAFNSLYAARGKKALIRHPSSLFPFFYPLDAVGNWNRLYGRRGFFQYQCVLPRENDAASMRALLDRIGRSGEASFLAVLKTFGSLPPEGLLSFPRAGLTLALDFPNRGESTRALFRDLDHIVRDAGGRLYPAKDACMSAEDFQRSYPALDHFRTLIDPAFTSDFWRRMHSEKAI